MSDRSDRRVEPRAPLVLKVEYPEYRDYLADWTANVSARGFFVATDRPFRVGDELETRITFPGIPEPVDLPARVMWWRPASADGPSGVGVKVWPQETPGTPSTLASSFGSDRSVMSNT